MPTRPAPLRVEATRSELVTTLEQRAHDWWHMGNKKADAARDAIERLKAGEASIRVGVTDYVVTEG